MHTRATVPSGACHAGEHVSALVCNALGLRVDDFMHESCMNNVLMYGWRVHGLCGNLCPSYTWVMHGLCTDCIDHIKWLMHA